MTNFVSHKAKRNVKNWRFIVLMTCWEREQAQGRKNEEKSGQINFVHFLFDKMLRRAKLIAVTPFVFVATPGQTDFSNDILRCDIRCVINVAAEIPDHNFPNFRHVENFKYPIVDSNQFPSWIFFDQVADRIAENVRNHRRTLVVCHQARSRSITFVLAYLIKHHELSLSTAFCLVRLKCPWARPNPGFWQQLQVYELRQIQRDSAIRRAKLRTFGREMLRRVSRTIERLFD